MSSRFRLPCLAEQCVALLSVGKSPGSFPRFSSHLLQSLLERNGVLPSITLNHHRVSPSLFRRAPPECRAGTGPSLTQVIHTRRKYSGNGGTIQDCEHLSRRHFHANP
jgi:hypothetical protein